MKKLLIGFLFPLLVYQPTSIYSFSVENLGGGIINFSQYQNKRILIVNIATGTADSSQIGELQQLYQQHSNDLAIVAFPSNSFGNEPHSNSELQAYLYNSYNITFPVAALGSVIDSPTVRHPVYDWLSSKETNGVLNGKVKEDFHKFLLNRQGKIVAYFDRSTRPLSQVVQTVLQIHQ